MQVKLPITVQKGYKKVYEIFHLRQGHKVECPFPTDFAAKKQSGIDSNDSDVESTFKSCDTSSVVDEKEEDDI